MFKSNLTFCLVYVFTVQMDEWCGHNRLFNANFEEKFKYNARYLTNEKNVKNLIVRCKNMYLSITESSYNYDKLQTPHYQSFVSLKV
jgi:hypothetical protein